MTTPVVAITSSRLGQVTCFISTRTSCRNSRVLAIVPVTFSPTPAAAPVMAFPVDSPFFTFTACVAMNPSSIPQKPLLLPQPQTLAGEEGLEPPYPVLETGVLAVG